MAQRRESEIKRLISTLNLLTSSFLKVSVPFVDGDLIFPLIDTHHSASSARAKGEARNTWENLNIDEIVAICSKLLISETPQGHITRALEVLTQAVLDRYSRNKQPECLNKIIGCLRDA